LALVIHAALVWNLFTHIQLAEKPTDPTLTITLPMLTPRPEPAPPVVAPESTEAPRLADVPPATEITPPPSFTWTPPQASPQSDLAGIGRSLFGCRIENLAGLSADERANCSRAGLGAEPNDAAVAALAQVALVESAPFERALVRKQQPLLLPCAGGIGISLYTVVCLADGVINGFDLDKYPVYEPWPDEQ
jgi:hypothetical protein